MNSELMQTFNFTTNDLAYNKKGRLSPRQSANLEKNNRTVATIMLILLLVSASFTIVVLRPYIFDGVEQFDDLARTSQGRHR